MTPYNNGGPDFEFPVQAKLSYENELVGFVCEEGGLNFIFKDGNQRKLVPEREVIHKVVLRGENDG